jgi:predicted permease
VPGLRRIICARRKPAQAQLPDPASVNSPVFASLIPVILCIGAGFLAARLGWVRAAAIKDLSNLVFLVLTPALLFRTMGAVRVQELDFQPVALYFLATALIFGVSMVLGGFSTRSAARGLANMFSNTVMIGVPLVGLVYGEGGLVTLFTLVSLHALILLTAATIVFELAEAREHQRSGQSAPRPMWRTVLQAVRNGIVHPVPLPILAGLLFAQTGLALPGVVDRSLQVLGQALGPMALLLVGVTLAYTKVGQNLREAVGIALVKNLAHPLLLLALAWAFGLGGLPVAVMFTAAALPVGANVFLFTQRYGVMQEEVSASIAVSTSLALLTVPLMLWLAQRLPG